MERNKFIELASLFIQKSNDDYLVGMTLTTAYLRDGFNVAFEPAPSKIE